MKKKGKILSDVTEKDIELLKKNPKKFWHGVNEILYNAFSDCKEPFEIEIPANVKVFGQAFINSGVKKVKINNADYLPPEIFKNCLNLEEVILPNNLTELNNFCFQNCEKLKSINLPDTITEIGHACFEGSAIEEVTMPKNLEIIRNNAFRNCYLLKKVTFANQKATDSFEKEFEGITLCEGCFKGCMNLEEVDNMHRIEKLQSQVFWGCRQLKSVDISNTTFINDKAFWGCKNLKNIKFSKFLTHIGKNAFSATGIESLTLEGVSKIDDSAFIECNNLKYVNLLNTFVSLKLGKSVFNCCENLEKVELPNFIESIPDLMFYNCRNLETVNFDKDSQLKYIGKSSFYNCTKLKEITNTKTPLSVIDEDAFKNCNSLSELELDENSSVKNNGLLKYICKVENRYYTSNYPMGEDYVEIGGNAYFMDLLFKNWNNKDFKDAFNKIGAENLPLIQKAYIFVNGVGKYYTRLDFIYNWGNNKVQKFVKNIDYINPSVLRYRLHEVKHESFLDLIDALNIDVYIKCLKTLAKNDIELDYFFMDRFFKFFYNLGGMQNLYFENKTKNGEIVKVSYDQKIAELLTYLLTRGKVDTSTISSISLDMLAEGAKPDFTEFILSKKDKYTYAIEDMFNAEKEIPGFFAKSYNKFYEIQKTNTSNKGSQKQLKPTFDLFYNHHLNQLSGVTEHNREIAKAIISNYEASSIQEVFENARVINAERLGYELNNKFHKLSYNQRLNVLNFIESNDIKELKKYSSVYKQIKPAENNILQSNLTEKIYLSRLNKLDGLINKCETVANESLKECVNTAQDFTFEWLNKADPLNMVLGKLCNCCAHLEGAGYGIMHASIIHPDVQNLVIKDKNGSIIAKSTLYVNRAEGYAVFNNVEVASGQLRDKDIYDKFMLGAEAFMKQYNLENKKPLKIITVGMNRNDLMGEFEDYNEVSKIYKAINYGEFGTDYLYYEGDSNSEQRVVCKLEEEMGE